MSFEMLLNIRAPEGFCTRPLEYEGNMHASKSCNMGCTVMNPASMKFHCYL
jgi:hypothetical protein